jgi:hypothetical protein
VTSSAGSDSCHGRFVDILSQIAQLRALPARRHEKPAETGVTGNDSEGAPCCSSSGVFWRFDTVNRRFWSPFTGVGCDFTIAQPSKARFGLVIAGNLANAGTDREGRPHLRQLGTLNSMAMKNEDSEPKTELSKMS